MGGHNIRNYENKLNPPLFIEVFGPSQESERCVTDIDFASFYYFDFEIVPTV